MARWTQAERKLVKLWWVPRRKRDDAWHKAWSDALRALHSSGKPWLMVKAWVRGTRRFEVDHELREEWLAALNDCAEACGAIITNVCAGHPHGVSGQGNYHPGNCGPSLILWFRGRAPACILARELAGDNTDVELLLPASLKMKPGSARLKVSCAIVHTGTNQRELACWWNGITTRFKSFAKIGSL